MQEPLKILLADDHRVLRTGLKLLLSSQGDFQVVAEASDGREVLTELEKMAVDIVLLDLSMPGMGGLELQAMLAQRGASHPVVFLTGCGDIASSVRAMKAGAVDFLEKPVQRQDLLDAIARALVLDKRQRRERSEIARLRECFALLSEREREVLEQVVAGKLNKQIAAALDVSERTIKTLRAQGMDKLGVASPAELGVLFERLRHEPDA